MKWIKNFLIGLWYKLVSVKNPIQEISSVQDETKAHQAQEFQKFILAIIEEAPHCDFETYIMYELRMGRLKKDEAIALMNDKRLKRRTSKGLNFKYELV